MIGEVHAREAARRGERLDRQGDPARRPARASRTNAAWPALAHDRDEVAGGVEPADDRVPWLSGASEKAPIISSES